MGNAMQGFPCEDGAGFPGGAAGEDGDGATKVAESPDHAGRRWRETPSP
jgi:hypothetical protein